MDGGEFTFRIEEDGIYGWIPKPHIQKDLDNGDMEIFDVDLDSLEYGHWEMVASVKSRELKTLLS